VPLDETDARAQEEDAGAKIAAEQQLVGLRRLRAAADLALADLAESCVEA